MAIDPHTRLVLEVTTDLSECKADILHVTTHEIHTGEEKKHLRSRSINLFTQL